ncbi:PAS domain-containing protein [Brevundimonas sp. 2R-24]|uniref:histidine kinase n=1 Tax=Peiella sedimenti TaxID=3061083 RepID=A0ABT8SPD3_9CAUL|nr:PAS domain-containing protein [Caulobacteraceae bacterium XZ-24]
MVRRLALAPEPSVLSAALTGLAAAATVLLVRLALTPVLGATTGFILFLPAVLAVALWKGRIGGLTALLASGLLAWGTAVSTQGAEADFARLATGLTIFIVVGLALAEIAVALRRDMSALNDSLEAERRARAAKSETESRFSMALQAGRLGAWEWDLASDRLAVSDGYRSNWGVEVEDGVAYLDLASKVHPDDQPAVMAARSRALLGEPYEVEYRVPQPDGSIRWCASEGRPQYDASGRVTKVLGVNRDITPQKVAEASLRESEQRFRLLSEAAPVMLWMSGPEGECQHLNRALRAFWGVSDDLSLFSWSDTLHPDDAGIVWRATAAALEAEAAFSVEARYRRYDGEWRTLTTEALPRFDADGAFLGMIGVNVDVTDARRAEAALRHSEARFRAVADNIPQIAWMADADGDIYWFNDRWYEFIGADPADGMTWDWNTILHPDYWGVTRERFFSNVAAGEPWEDTFPMRSAAGEWRWFLSRARPIRDESGAITQWFGTNTDITDLREAERVLRDEQSRKDFLIGLSDRLREVSDPDDLMRVAAEAVGAHLEADRAGFGEVDEAEERLSIRNAWARDGAADLTGLWTMRDFGPRLLADLKRGRPFAIADVCRDARTKSHADAYERIGVRGFLGAPLVRGNHLIALFFVHTNEPREWTEAEAQLVQELAARKWAALERARAQAAVRESEERFRAIANSAPILIWVTNADRTRAFVNETYVRFHGGTYEDALTADWRAALHPDDIDRVIRESLAGEASRKAFPLEARYRRHDGEYRWLRSYSQPRLDRTGALAGFVGVAYDITEARQVERDLTRLNELLEERVAAALEEKSRAEEALVHAQRMEAVGRLTGGVAHDFNNLLTVVIGGLEMILKSPEDTGRLKRLGEAALSAARRGEQLTHQLLAFSRKQELRPQVLNLTALIRTGAPLLKRAVGEAVELRLPRTRKSLMASVDAGQFEAALLNLIVNARDATPGGGRITIRCEAASLAEDQVRGLPAGDFARVSVEDTGSGIPPHVLDRIFEPFFTTKDVGKGTGLGLSQVHGFAHQSGGGVEVKSEPGRGTTVSILLPLLEASETAEPAPPSPRDRSHLSGRTVLLVEDDMAVGDIAADLLQGLGLKVERAGDAGEALSKLSQSGFDLLMTDIIMPGGMNGVALAREAISRRPRLAVLLSSGYPGDSLGDALQDVPWPLLRKPYDEAELTEALTDVLTNAASPN